MFYPTICWSDESNKFFPEFEIIKPALKFWQSVYLDITTKQGYLHDANKLNVVYTTLNIPNISYRSQARWLRTEKNKIRAQMDACSKNNSANDLCSKMPADWTPHDIRQARRNIRFQLGQSDRFKTGVKRSGRYLEKIKSIMEKAGLPIDLAYLPHVESSFDYDAYSRVGAAGIWQFMRSTGRQFLKINYIIDERIDPLAGTHAAAKLLKKNYETLGEWPLAITAYNHGRYGIKKLVRRLRTKDLGEIIVRERKRNFAFASRNFYAQFLVARKIAKNLDDYLPNIELETPKKFKLYKLTAYLSADQVATALGMDIATLRSYNPALRRPVWSGQKLIPKNYILKTPYNIDADKLMAALEKSEHSRKKQLVSKWHRVNRGDTLWYISNRYNIPMYQLLTLNNLSRRSRIYPGQIIQLPHGSEAISVAKNIPPKQKASPKSNTKPASIAVQVPSRPTPLKPDWMLEEERYLKAAKLLAAEETIIPSGETTEEDKELAEVPTQHESKFDRYSDMSSRLTNLGIIKKKNSGGQTLIQIQVVSDEALSFYADWALSPKRKILTASRMRANELYSGRIIWVPLGRGISPEEFESKRFEYHRSIEDDFFNNFQIVDTKEHVVRSGDQLWDLAIKKYDIPLWLLHRLNKEQQIAQLQVGMRLKIPVVHPRL